MKYKRKLGHKEKREEREERSNIPNTYLIDPVHATSEAPILSNSNSNSRRIWASSYPEVLNYNYNMFPTRRLAQGGFFKRSADEFGRLSKIGKLCQCRQSCSSTNLLQLGIQKPSIPRLNLIHS